MFEMNALFLSILLLWHFGPLFTGCTKFFFFIVWICSCDLISIFNLFQDKVLISQWKDEIINGHKLSAQIVASMTTKASKMYGAAISNSPSSENFKPPLEHRNSNGS